MTKLHLWLTLISSIMMGKSLAMNKVQVIAANLHESLSSLPYQPLLNSIIEGKVAGDFFSNEPEKYVLVKSRAEYAYLAGHLEEDTLNFAAKTLSGYDEVLLICDERYHHWFLKNGYSLCPRIALEYMHKNINLTPFPQKNKLTMQFINAEIFPKCMWNQFISSRYGGAETFLHNSFGIALCDIHGNIAGEAYAASIGKGLCEVGIITNRDYQGQGIATHAAAQIAKQCLERQLTPVWSCYTENTASLHVALKLGFTITRYYAFLKK